MEATYEDDVRAFFGCVADLAVTLRTASPSEKPTTITNHLQFTQEHWEALHSQRIAFSRLPLHLQTALSPDDIHAVLADRTRSTVVREISAAIVRGKAIYAKHSYAIQTQKYKLDSSVRGHVPWKTILFNAYLQTHVLIVIQLTEDSVGDLKDLLLWKAFFYRALATTLPAKFAKEYEKKESTLQPVEARKEEEKLSSEYAFFFDMIITAAELTDKRKKQVITSTVEYIKLVKTVKLVLLGNELLPALRIVRLPQIMAVYETLYSQLHGSGFNEAFSKTINELQGRVYRFTELAKDFGQTGVTLPCKSIVMHCSGDAHMRHYPKQLLEGNYTIILLHEMAHYLLRAETQKWGDFRAVQTPPSSPPTTPRLYEGDLIENMIQRFVLGPKTREAGVLVEEALFRNQPVVLTIEAAERLLTLNEESSLPDFTEAFCRENNPEDKTWFLQYTERLQRDNEEMEGESEEVNSEEFGEEMDEELGGEMDEEMEEDVRGESEEEMEEVKNEEMKEESKES